MIEVGTVLDEKVFYLDRAMLKAYADASGDQNPIHQNEEFALSVGLPSNFNNLERNICWRKGLRYG